MEFLSFSSIFGFGWKIIFGDNVSLNLLVISSFYVSIHNGKCVFFLFHSKHVVVVNISLAIRWNAQQMNEKKRNDKWCYSMYHDSRHKQPQRNFFQYSIEWEGLFQHRQRQTQRKRNIHTNAIKFMQTNAWKIFIFSTNNWIESHALHTMYAYLLRFGYLIQFEFF